MDFVILKSKREVSKYLDNRNDKLSFDVDIVKKPQNGDNIGSRQLSLNIRQSDSEDLNKSQENSNLYLTFLP